VFLKPIRTSKLDDPGGSPWLTASRITSLLDVPKRSPKTDVEEVQPEASETGITVGGSSVFPIELSLAVASALRRLSPEQRESVVLKIYQGFKFEEMAEILSCPVSTIKSRCIRPSNPQNRAGSDSDTRCS